jgi:hypothetical protein
MKLFKSFNESLNTETPINESYDSISVKGIDNQEDLEKYVVTNLPNAIEKLFNDELKMKYSFEAKIIKGRTGTHVRITGEEIKPKDMGLFNLAISKASINSFSMGDIPKGKLNDDNEFEFASFIWFTLSISINLNGGGSNGLGIVFPGESDGSLYYSIKDNKVYTDKEASKYMK